MPSVSRDRDAAKALHGTSCTAPLMCWEEAHSGRGGASALGRGLGAYIFQVL